jgi:hypothetical protein
MKIGDLVTIDKFCAPPGLYGLGIVIKIFSSGNRAKVVWNSQGLAKSAIYRIGSCAIRYLHKAEIK